MIKTQVQIPDELFERAKAVAAAKEWSFAEIVRRGLEYMVAVHPQERTRGKTWRLPPPVNLGLVTDPMGDEGWREESELTSGAARLLAVQLREKAARYEAGS